MSRTKGRAILSFNSEPKIQGLVDKIQLVEILNWYSSNAETKDYAKWAVAYFRKQYKIDASNAINESYRSFGHVCRIVSNGAELPKENQIWFEQKIEQILKAVNVQNELKTKVVKQTPVRPTIQENLSDAIDEVIAELEGSFDEYMQNGFKTEPNSMAILSNSLKRGYANKIIDFCQNKQQEYNEVLTSGDSQLDEGYSNFKKIHLKKMIAYARSIIDNVQTLNDSVKKTRKPRKKKVIPASQVVSKLKYQKDFAELNLVSIDPKDIVGATQLWVYNTKYRKLGCYHVDPNFTGLTVKGTSILNYDVEKSLCKRLRKPEEVIPEIMKGGKIFLRTALQKIKTTDVLLSGRINEETLLLRIIK